METATMMDKRPLADTLRGMKVGDSEVFPISQYQSVRNYQYGGMRPERSLGWRFRLEIDKQDPTRFTVTRTA